MNYFDWGDILGFDEKTTFVRLDGKLKLLNLN